MKLAEGVAKILEQNGIRHVFGVSGGASLHLIHGITDATSIQFVPTTHECNAGFAADSYARLRGIGCALATSGPGATNLVTAIAASYYDSVPVVYLTGNVATFRFGAPLGVRQYGFQETPIVEMVAPVTKYAVQIIDPHSLIAEMDYAISVAKRGRPGPVLIDIPDDIQRADIDAAALQHEPEPLMEARDSPDCTEVVRMLQEARRPIFVWGAGIRPYADAARTLARSLGVPVACTWGAIDLMHSDDPLMAGGFGTHGNRGANFAVQNADLVLAVGTRLDTKATANPRDFARGAAIIMVDIDGGEIRKFEKLGRKIDVGIEADAGAFIAALDAAVTDRRSRPIWLEHVWEWKGKYPSKDDPSWSGKPYELVRRLAASTTPDDIIVSDTGTALGYLMQAFPFKGERFIHAFNATPMGYGLPAAIGAAFASERRVVLVTGDGSILMALSELATIRRHGLPIEIILLDNKGHAMCRQTQRQWLGGHYPATSIEGGLGFPDFRKVAEAFGVEIEVHEIDPDAQLIPQAKFGQPLEDADPQLPREEFRANMIIEPL